MLANIIAHPERPALGRHTSGSPQNKAARRSEGHEAGAAQSKRQRGGDQAAAGQFGQGGLLPQDNMLFLDYFLGSVPIVSQPCPEGKGMGAKREQGSAAPNAWAFASPESCTASSGIATVARLHLVVRL